MNLLLAVTLLAAGPFVGEEQRFVLPHSPSDLVLASSPGAVLMAWNEGGRIRARVGDVTRDLGTGFGVAAASDGRDFLIVWMENGRVVGARWNDPTTLRAYGSGATIRSTASVVWDGRYFQVFGSFVDSAAAIPGIVLTTLFRSEPEGYRCVPGGMTVHCGVFPANYIVEWRTHGEHGSSRTHAAGYTHFFSPYAPGVAPGKGEFAITWRAPQAIDGRRIGLDGGVLGFFSIPVPRPLTGRRGPQIAWDGTRYLVAFDMLGETGDIWGAVVVPGQNYVADAFLIAGSGAQEFSPAVTAIGPDRFLVAYTSGTDAIATRVVSFNEPPQRRRAAR